MLTWHHRHYRTAVIKGALPHKYEMVGDILFLPELALMKFGWQSVLNQCENDDTPITTSSTKEVINDDDKNEAVKQIWKGLLELYAPATRIARRSRVDEGPMRESRVEVLYPLSRSEWDALRPVGAVEKAAKLLQGTTEVGDLDYNDMERGMIGWDFSSSHVYASSLPPSSINAVDGTPGSTVERDNEENKYNTAIHQDHRTLVSPAVYDRVLMTFAKSIGKRLHLSFRFSASCGFYP
jgi:tRNA G37 N-methylase Trm5